MKARSLIPKLGQERETSAQPRSEDRIKRLGDENKKLIHLVTALDQQVSVLEGKLNRTIADGEKERTRHNSVDRGSGGGLTRDEVLRIVRDTAPAPPDNQERGDNIVPNLIWHLFYFLLQSQCCSRIQRLFEIIS